MGESVEILLIEYLGRGSLTDPVLSLLNAPHGLLKAMFWGGVEEGRWGLQRERGG